MFELLNNSKFFTGVTMLAVNLGSKYLAHELSESQQELFNNKIIRRFILFTVVFMATRDIYVSLILTVHWPTIAASISTTSTLLVLSAVPPVEERPLAKSFPR